MSAKQLPPPEWATPGRRVEVTMPKGPALGNVICIESRTSRIVRVAVRVDDGRRVSVPAGDVAPTE